MQESMPGRFTGHWNCDATGGNKKIVVRYEAYGTKKGHIHEFITGMCYELIKVLCNAFRALIQLY